MDIKLTHIFHSGFLLETEEMLMVFDYYQGHIPLKDKKTLVFVSHGHGDHYTEDIFNWQEDIKDISYILSYDIENPPKSKNIYAMKPYETLTIEDLHIRSFSSTDLGLSFLISYKDKNIFFSGDLNWWHWENDSKEMQEDGERQFKNEIEKIKKIGKDIDLAFFPVDPRLAQGFSLGGEYIIKELSPSYLIPMHFGDKYDTSKKFIHELGPVATSIVDINEKGQVVKLKL